MNKEDYSGIHPDTYKMLFSDNKNLPKEELATNENTMILATLNVFTKLEHKSIFIKFLKKRLSHNLNVEVDKIIYNEETKEYEYKVGERTITFRMISDIVKDKEFLKELKSNKRFGKCHERSFQLAPNIENSKIVKSNIGFLNKNELLAFINEK